MKVTRTPTIAFFAAYLAGAAGLQGHSSCLAMSAEAAPRAQENTQSTVKKIGVVKGINGNTITVNPDSGSEVNVTAQDTTRILRIAPGEKNLKNATPAQLQDLQVGDRILVAGKASEDAKTIVASSIVLMKGADLVARHEQEQQDWQKRGLGGLVSAVDQATGTVTISITGFSGTKSVAIHTSKSTVFRRYAPDSVKFDDAKASTLQEIHTGDQLRARGDRSAEGAEVTAEEIVSGDFINVAGTVNSVDASSNTINVQDLLSKKAVEIKVSQDSQLHKLPSEMAQHIAMRLKGAAGGAAGAAGPGASAPQGQASGTAAGSGEHAAPGGGRSWGGNGMGGGMSGGAPDFQQILNRMPAVAVADLHKGDAVLIVATGGGTAITLLSGVEPILQAAPSASSAMMLTPWNLGGAPGGDAGQ